MPKGRRIQQHKRTRFALRLDENDLLGLFVLCCCWLFPVIFFVLAWSYGAQFERRFGFWPSVDGPMQAEALNWRTLHTTTWMSFLGSWILLFIAFFISLFYAWSKNLLRLLAFALCFVISALWLAASRLPHAAELIDWITA